MLRIMFQVFYSEFSVRMWHDISTETTFLCLELTNPTDSLNCPTHCVSSTAISTPAVHTGQLMVIHGTFSAYHIIPLPYRSRFSRLRSVVVLSDSCLFPIIGLLRFRLNLSSYTGSDLWLKTEATELLPSCLHCLPNQPVGKNLVETPLS